MDPSTGGWTTQEWSAGTVLGTGNTPYDVNLNYAGAPTIKVLGAGRIMVVWTGSEEFMGRRHVVVTRSQDNGLTWERPVSITETTPGAVGYEDDPSSVSLHAYEDQSGVRHAVVLYTNLKSDTDESGYRSYEIKAIRWDGPYWEVNQWSPPVVVGTQRISADVLPTIALRGHGAFISAIWAGAPKTVGLSPANQGARLLMLVSKDGGVRWEDQVGLYIADQIGGPKLQDPESVNRMVRAPAVTVDEDGNMFIVFQQDHAPYPPSVHLISGPVQDVDFLYHRKLGTGHRARISRNSAGASSVIWSQNNYGTTLNGVEMHTVGLVVAFQDWEWYHWGTNGDAQHAIPGTGDLASDGLTPLHGGVLDTQVQLSNRWLDTFSVVEEEHDGTVLWALKHRAGELP
jgi:hypothetical protein